MGKGARSRRRTLESPVTRSEDRRRPLPLAAPLLIDGGYASPSSRAAVVNGPLAHLALLAVLLAAGAIVALEAWHAFAHALAGAGL